MNDVNINGLKRSILVLFFIVGLILFIDGIFLHKINTDVHLTIANYHIHHWMYGLAMTVIGVVGAVLLLFSRSKNMKREIQKLMRKR